jgi:hypothetical protein
MNKLFALFERLTIISLKTRLDRRREVERQLAKVGLGYESPKVHLFDAYRPDQAAPFPSVGAHGCFMSHLGALEDALNARAQTLLILEDDADFARDIETRGPLIADSLQQQPWDIAYLGGLKHFEPSSDEALFELQSTERVQNSHAIAFSRRALEKVVPYLHAMKARPGGSPEGGPMHVDGAYCWFRAAHPELRALITKDELVVQRSSKSDIADEPSLLSRLPGIGLARKLKNRLAAN